MLSRNAFEMKIFLGTLVNTATTFFLRNQRDLDLTRTAFPFFSV